MSTTFSTSSRAALAAVLLATVAACGRGETAADSAAGVLDTSRLGPGVGDARQAMDSGYRAAQDRLDSLKASGVTPTDGILRADSAAARALTTDSNATPRIPAVTAPPVPAKRP